MSRAAPLVPPNALDAERAVLGGILVDNEVLDVVTEILSADDFYSAANAQIYEAMRELWGGGAPVDHTTLRAELVQHGKLAAVGGDEYLLGLTHQIPTLDNAAAHARIVRRCSTLRLLILACHEVQATAYGAIDDVPRFLDEAETKIFAATQTLGQARDSSERVGAISGRRYAQLEEAQRTGRVPGIPTRITGLDTLLRGLHPGHLDIISGRPGVGKTALAGVLALNVSRQDHPVLWWSGEMPREDCTDRLLAAEARIDGNRMRGAQLSREDWPKLADAVAELARLPLIIDDTPAITLHQLRARARRVRKAEGGLALIVVDMLQLVRSGQRHDKREEEIATVSRGLKALAGELGCTVLALSAMVKGDRTAKDKRPRLEDLRGPNEIGHDPNAVIFLYRDEMENPDTKDAGIAEIIVAKQRSGPTGTVRIRFYREYTRFDNLDNWEPEPPESELYS